MHTLSILVHFDRHGQHDPSLYGKSCVNILSNLYFYFHWIISACGVGMPRGFPFNELSSMFNSSACLHCWFITLFLLWKGSWVNEFLTLMKRVTWICSQHVYSMGRSLRRPLGRSHMTGNGLRNVIDICCLQWGLICVHTHTHTLRPGTAELVLLCKLWHTKIRSSVWKHTTKLVSK